jgi:hypothetical protein
VRAQSDGEQGQGVADVLALSAVPCAVDGGNWPGGRGLCSTVLEHAVELGWAHLTILFYSNLLQLISKDQFQKYKTPYSISPKFLKFGKVADKFKVDKFPFCPNLKISIDFE